MMMIPLTLGKISGELKNEDSSIPQNRLILILAIWYGSHMTA